MNALGALGVSLFVLFVFVAAITYRRSNGARRLRSQRGFGSATGQTFAVHLPSDDPHWREYSERKASPKTKRRKVWAAGTAGAVGTTYTGPHGGCSAGAGCGGGGGGGCGGGCGGG